MNKKKIVLYFSKYLATLWMYAIVGISIYGFIFSKGRIFTKQTIIGLVFMTIGSSLIATYKHYKDIRNGYDV